MSHVSVISGILRISDIERLEESRFRRPLAGKTGKTTFRYCQSRRSFGKAVLLWKDTLSPPALPSSPSLPLPCPVRTGGVLVPGKSNHVATYYVATYCVVSGHLLQ
jgi:hypothetical protein